MSHFVVVVTNTDTEGLESQLEPFYEQGEESDYFMEKEYYLENNEKAINDWLDNEKKHNQEILKNNIKDEKGDWAKYLKKTNKEIERIRNLKTTKGKLKAIQTFNGGGRDEKGLYWLYNPEARWDWWVEGGRWDKWLVKKNGEKCNCCRVEELDFDGMRKNNMEDRGRWYDEEMEKAKEENREPWFWGWEKVPTREEYVESANRPVAPYAVLHDGEWIEKGSMGWFGISDDKYSDDEWAVKFQEFIKTLDPESEITIVDCHI